MKTLPYFLKWILQIDPNEEKDEPNKIETGSLYAGVFHQVF